MADTVGPVEVYVRPARLGDAIAIARVQRRSRSIAYRSFLPIDWVELSPDAFRQHEDRWRKVLMGQEARPLQTWVAEVEGEVVGFVSIGPSNEEDDEAGAQCLSALYVDPAHWRRGTGRALLRAAIEAFIAAGLDCVTLWTYESASAARAFYEAEGWRQDGRARSHPSGLAPRQLRYRLMLPPTSASQDQNESLPA